MKTTKILHLPVVLLGLALYLCGCATANSTAGRDFDSSKVSQIVKGITRADEILAVFGTPGSKQPEAENAERWIYSYITATAHAQAGWFGSMHTTITGGHKKILNLLINKEKVVVNFTFDDGPIEPQETKSQSF